MLTYMTTRRTTLILLAALDARLRQEAARRGITVSDLTREAIAAHLGVAEEDADGTEPPSRRLAFFGSFDGDGRELTDRVDDLYGAELERAQAVEVRDAEARHGRA